MTLFLRTLSANITGDGVDLTIDNLRISFDITKTTSPEANSGKFKIYNLSDNSKNKIKKLDDEIILRAGYEEDVGPKLIFRGNITEINHKKEFPNTITNLQAGDGVKALRDTRQSFSFKEGTKARKIIQEIANGFNLTLRPLPELETAEYVKGFSYVGPLKEAMIKIANKQNAEWSIQNKEIQILSHNGTLPGTPKVISEDQGLLEEPEKLQDQRDNLEGREPKPGYKIKSLLRPEIEPGKRVEIISNNINGIFRVEQIKHKGDNFGSNYTSEIDVSEL